MEAWRQHRVIFLSDEDDGTHLARVDQLFREGLTLATPIVVGYTGDGYVDEDGSWVEQEGKDITNSFLTYVVSVSHVELFEHLLKTHELTPDIAREALQEAFDHHLEQSFPKRMVDVLIAAVDDPVCVSELASNVLYDKRYYISGPNVAKNKAALRKFMQERNDLVVIA